MKEDKEGKRIQFDNLSSWPFWVLLGIGTVCFLIGFLTAGLQSDLFMVGGYFSMVLFLSRPFFYSKYVGWNKKGMQLKLSFLGMKSIPFKSIEDVTKDEGSLNLKMLDGKIHKFDIKDTTVEDIQRLQNLINHHACLSIT